MNVNTLVIQLNQTVINLSEALVIWWMVWIKLFNFNIKHVSEKKYNTVNDFSQKSENSSLNEETDIINDFINSQLNSIQIYSVFIKKSRESIILKNDYSEKSIKIAVFFISLQWLSNLTIKEFQKFKEEVLRYVISSWHLF